jgi:hypothetical protein
MDGFCYRSEGHGLLWIHGIEYEYSPQQHFECRYRVRDSSRQDVPIEALSPDDHSGIRDTIKNTLLESVREWDSRWIER